MFSSRKYKDRNDRMIINYSEIRINYSEIFIHYFEIFTHYSEIFIHYYAALMRIILIWFVYWGLQSYLMPDRHNRSV